jgi:hypothetical protein
MSGLATDGNGNPIVYRDVADEFVNVTKDSYNGSTPGGSSDSPIVNHNPTLPGPSASPGTPATPSSPAEHPIEPGSPYPLDPVPYAGLLGPHVQVNFSNRTYKNAQGQDTPIPIPSNDYLTAGDQGRVWYVDVNTQPNIQHLLTDGDGPPVSNSGYPVGSPQNTPPSKGSSSSSSTSGGSTTQSSSGGTVTKSNSQVTKNISGGQS